MYVLSFNMERPMPYSFESVREPNKKKVSNEMIKIGQTKNWEDRIGFYQQNYGCDELHQRCQGCDHNHKDFIDFENTRGLFDPCGHPPHFQVEQTWTVDFDKKTRLKIENQIRKKFKRVPGFLDCFWKEDLNQILKVMSELVDQQSPKTHKINFQKYKTTKEEVMDFFSNNYSCRKCFNNPSITKKGKEFEVADVKGPQPRWIGKNYFRANKKVCVMLINPGSGDKTPENDWSPLKLLSYTDLLKEKEQAWEELMKTNEKGMPTWDNWKLYYLNSLGLEKRIDDVSFMNMMLCASRGNSYSDQSLQLCFSTQSNKLLQLLSPDILIFSGGMVLKNMLNKFTSLKDMRIKSSDNSREIEFSKVKKVVTNNLKKDCRYFYMGHYSKIWKTNQMIEEDLKDAKIISSFLNDQE